jgi:rubrerythrin
LKRNEEPVGRALQVGILNAKEHAMSSEFETSDIFEIAVRIEENGINFYRYAVQIAGDEKTKHIFEFLAGEEEKHKNTFRSILSRIEYHTVPETYSGEYGAYLRNYVDNNIIFTKEIMDREMAAIKNELEAIDFARRRELDSILYYQEVKQFVSKDHHGDIDKIINEERNHFRMLSELKKNL